MDSFILVFHFTCSFLSFSDQIPFKFGIDRLRKEIFRKLLLLMLNNVNFQIGPKGFRYKYHEQDKNIYMKKMYCCA